MGINLRIPNQTISHQRYNIKKHFSPNLESKSRESPSSDLDGIFGPPSSSPSSNVQEKVKTVDGAKDALLEWVRSRVFPYGVEIRDFSSFSDGKAFAALIHSISPDAIDYSNISNIDKRSLLTKDFASAFSHFKM